MAEAAGKLAGRIALITGASRGIGAAVATRFAAEGAHLVLVARSQGGLEEVDDAVRAAGASATLVPLDLTDLEGVDRLGAALNERFGRLDVLVGNAAILGPLSPVHHIEAKAWDEVLRVNLTANWRLLRTCDPLLRQSEAGRAIFVTSGAGSSVFPFWGAYATSKAALEMMVKTYARETEKTAIRANIVDPGVVATAMRAEAFPGEDPSRHPPPESVADAFLALALPSCKKTGAVIQA
ncbi:MAG: SDR family NAD(P)-dependent oxidoreductase [Alphaproteobacteria bacterium]|nr:SDR family NAD(P)-dependent oxidoreductase [Alphaproteobacteria bacterium]